ncbi:MAG: glutamate--tRNA ligase [Flavipsychrobacter sp.]|nr:glutamate--tRNA ligase [Flavipsychrobacter sp.]
MSNKVRVRFAPSPTGGLHLGGVRTVLYNYLFARHHGGEFVLRIEDTDQTRFVEGAEEYIYKCLEWCGLEPDESTKKGGPYAPYRQSERKHLYYQYAQQLVDKGYAYYAFDTPEELERRRSEMAKDGHAGTNFQYDATTRRQMRNSLSLSTAEVLELLDKNTPYVIRIKVPFGQTVTFTDMIRGEITFDTSLVDDKVLLKADGMPTYHLAVVVDDYLMKITHAFRGEEWLPSAPVHLLLWKYLGWEADMPQWAHLPLILKPDGNGKLSKRDGDRLGFPVFAMDWNDPKTGETTRGFKEIGFLPEAFVNMLAMLGWNPGKEQELFSLSELVQYFSIERVHKGGAKFDYEKAKWYNQQHIHHSSDEKLLPLVKPYIVAHAPAVDDTYLLKVIGLVKERCGLLPDFWEQGHFFFETPEIKELDAIKAKWDDNKRSFFNSWKENLSSVSDWEHTTIEQTFTDSLQQHGLKKGDIMLPLRIMLVGGKYGPGVFVIAEMIGKEETLKRIQNALSLL